MSGKAIREKIRTLLAWAVVIGTLGACFDLGLDVEEGPELTVVLRIQGRVVTEPGGEPISGATVNLGWGGVFSFPTTRKSTNTDVLGQYEITDTLTYRDPCPFQWMQAEAEGYEGLRGIEDFRVGVLCTPSIQTIDIPLEPDSVAGG